MGVNLKVKIDQVTCIGCGLCENVCSSVFEMNGEVSQLIEEYQGDEANEGEVPDDKGCVQSAAQECPVDAIEVE